MTRAIALHEQHAYDAALPLYVSAAEKLAAVIQQEKRPEQRQKFHDLQKTYIQAAETCQQRRRDTAGIGLSLHVRDEHHGTVGRPQASGSKDLNPEDQRKEKMAATRLREAKEHHRNFRYKQAKDLYTEVGHLRARGWRCNSYVWEA